MELSIIIVNWNSKEILQACLDSIQTQSTSLEFETIVIDSASFDGCGEMLREHYPKVRFIQSEENLGFAKSNNVAFKASTGEVILFLNPDTELKGAALDLLYDALRSLPKAGVVGAKLLNSDSTIQTSCIQAFPTILNQVLDAEFLRNRFPRSKLWGTAPLFSGRDTPAEVDAISGACLMITRELFDQIGGFNAKYFMYSEDVDLCLMSRRSGHRNYIVPDAIVVHHGGTSSDQSNQSTFSAVMLLESRWKYFAKTRAFPYPHLYRASMFVICMVRVLFSFFFYLGEVVTSRGRRWAGVLRKWCARLRWTLGLERWVKEYRA